MECKSSFVYIRSLNTYSVNYITSKRKKKDFNSVRLRDDFIQNKRFCNQIIFKNHFPCFDFSFIFVTDQNQLEL